MTHDVPIMRIESHVAVLKLQLDDMLHRARAAARAVKIAREADEARRRGRIAGLADAGSWSVGEAERVEELVGGAVDRGRGSGGLGGGEVRGKGAHRVRVRLEVERWREVDPLCSRKSSVSF